MSKQRLRQRPLGPVVTRSFTPTTRGRKKSFVSPFGVPVTLDSLPKVTKHFSPPTMIYLAGFTWKKEWLRMFIGIVNKRNSAGPPGNT